MGVFDVRIETFEVYNQPLNENPNTADLLGPAIVAMRDEQDFMEHVKLTIVAILGRKDIHKFQNIIEDGKTPSFELPDTRLTLSVEPNSFHESHIPVGGTPIVVKVGHMQIMDWVNDWMYRNSPYPYRPCPYGPTMDQNNFDDGYDNAYVLGAVYNSDKTGYHVLVSVELGGDNQEFETRIVEDVTIPLVPEGTFSTIYYSLGFMDLTEEIEGEGEGDLVTGDSVCEGIANPAARKEGAGGFVWKPVSDARGTAVVLFPKGSPGGAASIQGVETGDYRGLTNGGRPTTYFSKPGSGYAGPITVCSGTGGSGSGSIGGDEIELCGVVVVGDDTDISFGEENGELITFPPIPVRSDNQNYYDKFDEGKVHDIERLGKLFEIRTERLVDDIMESDELVGKEEKVDDIYINFGARIHDNSKANCKYLYLFFQHIVGMVGEVGTEFSDRCTGGDGIIFGIGAATESGVSCNIVSARSGDYYYEFGFTYVEEGQSNISEVMADENLKDQFEDRRRTSRPWYLSSSEGDGSAGEDYDQPESAEDYLTVLLEGDGSTEHHITIYECWPSGEINTLTVYGFNGRMRITDNDTGITRTIQMNPEDPNSITVPYVPAIGEVLTNHELADCFLTGLHVTIMVADVELKSVPWWITVAMIVVTIVLAWTGYGGTLAAFLNEMLLEIIITIIIGYMVAGMVTGIASQYGGVWGTIASIVGAALLALVGSGQSLEQLFKGAARSYAAMSLTQILNKALSIISGTFKATTAGDLGGIQDSLESGAEDYKQRMLGLEEEQREYWDESGSFVGIEPLLDDLINTSIRTRVNPMSASTYFDLYDNFHNIGTDLLDVDKIYESSFNMDTMLQPV